MSSSARCYARRTPMSGSSPPRPEDTPARESAAEERATPGGAATVDEMSESSFPASDPPATWIWDVPDLSEARGHRVGG